MSVDEYTIGSADGLRVSVTNYGAAITSIVVPVDDDEIDVAISGMQLDDYELNSNYCGAIVGRYANRIAAATFELEGETFKLSENETLGGNCLHGGEEGFHRRYWAAFPEGESSIRFDLVSEDGDQGFPGTLKVSVVYSIPEEETLRIDFRATTDKTTVVSLTNHTYFNLDGDPRSEGAIGEHEIYIAADAYTPTNEVGIPFGAIESVADTALDMRDERILFDHLASGDPEIEERGGFDHNFVLQECDRYDTAIASAYSAKSRLQLEVRTSQPGLQFYTANTNPPPFVRQGSFCFEPQSFPDAPNQPGFPSPVLRPGDVYEHFIEYRFSIRE
jgi:aldose 1-epimerase